VGKKKARNLQLPPRDEPEDASSFTRRLKNSTGPLPDPFSRRLKYLPVQE